MVCRFWDTFYLISIHAPREGCDLRDMLRSVLIKVFQSTHPVRGATNRLVRDMVSNHISIHAPREGCDEANASTGRSKRYFNPRTP